MSLYKIIVINLKRRIDRKNYISELFFNINLEKYNFYQAVDGNNIELSLEIKNLFKDNDFGYRKGIIGCALSHYNIWLDLLEDNNNYYIIFEDDIDFDTNNFIKYLNNAKEYIENNSNIDILFLGFSKTNNNLYFNNIVNNNIDFIPFNHNLFLGGTFGYIITKSGAEKMINYINNNGIKHGIDYLFKIIPNLNMIMIKPSIVLFRFVQPPTINPLNDETILP
jgi:GR25 family glycosyltransferase involved in LPS biosynthesis